MLNNFVKKMARRVLRSQTIKDELLDSLESHLQSVKSVSDSDITLASLPDRYCLKQVAGLSSVKEKAKPIFVTARFRSGSTFLWNIFRQTRGVTAFYEPLNEAKWFAVTDGREVDPSHKMVSNYHREYASIRGLEDCFDESWTRRNLFMGERYYAPNLRKYIDVLVAQSQGRPVLQFNRMDFRLPWLRAQYPDSVIIHLSRHPRDQWMSIIGAGDFVPADFCAFGPWQFKLFYTEQWAKDLKAIFPFLDSRQITHPYILHYLLWRLSQAFGKTYANTSILYEDLVEDFEPSLTALYSDIGIQDYNISELKSLNKGVISSKWRGYASQEWFESHEVYCEELLSRYFGTNS